MVMWVLEGLLGSWWMLRGLSVDLSFQLSTLNVRLWCWIMTRMAG